MAERRPDSLLFSLKELRRIEDARVKQEEKDEQDRTEAERQAKAAAIQRAQDEEEAKRRAEEERLRREEEERERQVREGQLRVQEAERRARVEAEMKLQQQRLSMEMEAKSHARRSVQWKLFWGTLISLILIGSGLGYLFWSKSQQADAERVAKEAREKQARDLLAKMAEKERLFQQQQDDLNKKINDLMASLANAKDDAKRELIRKQIAQQQEAAANLAQARQREKAAEMRRAKRIHLKGGDDPLGGLGL